MSIHDFEEPVATTTTTWILSSSVDTLWIGGSTSARTAPSSRHDEDRANVTEIDLKLSRLPCETDRQGQEIGIDGFVSCASLFLSLTLSTTCNRHVKEEEKVLFPYAMNIEECSGTGIASGFGNGTSHLAGTQFVPIFYFDPNKKANSKQELDHQSLHLGSILNAAMVNRKFDMKFKIHLHSLSYDWDAFTCSLKVTSNAHECCPSMTHFENDDLSMMIIPTIDDLEHGNVLPEHTLSTFMVKSCLIK
jgi:hypothetical protein